MRLRFSYEAEKNSVENLRLLQVHQMPGVIDDFQSRIRNATLDVLGVLGLSDCILTAGND